MEKMQYSQTGYKHTYRICNIDFSWQQWLFECALMLYYVACLNLENHLNEQEKERVVGKDKREKEPPDRLGKQNRGGEGSLLQSLQVMTFLQ
jgi:hypothetical protein